ncbi:hypothetical protein ZIOFF_034141 [Zingiber officinale]|uniref:Protein kinase domain-containing protein n=1 Tax=Zingiber officinale TaxID=94328 RepID=A0A8J5L842_ZINOF|nr:hypothetical protein ZIOFF_034141 [Zingiber officinale]
MLREEKGNVGGEFQLFERSIIHTTASLFSLLSSTLISEQAQYKYPTGNGKRRFRKWEMCGPIFSKMSFISQRGEVGLQILAVKDTHASTSGPAPSNRDGESSLLLVAAIKHSHLSQGFQREKMPRLKFLDILIMTLQVDLLSRLHSGHLVGLIGYCADQHHRLLVFEYMPNGNLQHHLHPKSKNQNHRPLDWWTRLSIALDCARALEFLHEHTVPAVIHRDFKCSNILLDHNCRAKVSDFGMAKVGSDKINGQILTRVLGTTGYVAPEYASTGKLTTKSDVYSFGVVLLELITGRVPVDPARPQGEHVLVSWALPRLTNREKVMEMVDPVLSGQFSKKELVQVAAIAAVCVQAEADYRPLMTDVVQSLIPLVVKNSMAAKEGSVVDLEGQCNE